MTDKPQPVIASHDSPAFAVYLRLTDGNLDLYGGIPGPGYLTLTPNQLDRLSIQWIQHRIGGGT